MERELPLPTVLVRFLVDNPLSPEAARLAGDAATMLFLFAITSLTPGGLCDSGARRVEGRAGVSAGWDFSMLLVLWLCLKPSFILPLEAGIIHARNNAGLILENLRFLESELVPAVIV